MGIPSFFSYIIKNHSSIVKKQLPDDIDILLIDANSIIYDIVHMGANENNTIIQKVIEQLWIYIHMFSPKLYVYIAFDGVACMAKMEQQRTRRYKSWFLEENMTTKEMTTKEMTTTTTIKEPTTPIQPKFNTMCISPGTPFMNQLSDAITKEFTSNTSCVSSSKESGEGEHKLFEYLRNNPNINANVVIYGLDADLIMLSILHVSYTKNIYICREAPEFGEKNAALAKEMLCLDSQLLTNNILVEMDCKCQNIGRITDYIFLCFFLGNDFLTGFPSISIRTTGIQRLLDTYRLYIGAYDRLLIHPETKKIQWKWVTLFLQMLAKQEKENLIQEYASREIWAKQTWHRLLQTNKTNTNQPNKSNHPNKSHPNKSYSIDSWVDSVPLLFREREEYICPTEPHWEKRYYRSLLRIQSTSEIHDVCINYLEGLEFVYHYYTQGCPDINWKYRYAYSPLLCDLYKTLHTTNNNNNTMYLCANDKQTSRTERDVLKYILPPPYFEKMFDTSKNDDDDASVSFTWEWSFKRYLWESHIHL